MSALDSELELALERIPELADADRVVTPIAGGMTNRNFRVRTAVGDYVVRLGVKETGQLGIDRDNEDHNSRLAAAAGVGVRVVARLHDPEALVVEFVSGATLAPEDFRDPRRVAVLARLLRTLHGAPAFSRDFDMVEVQHRYHEIVVEHSYPLPDGYARYEERARVGGGDPHPHAHPDGAVPQRPDARELHRVSGAREPHLAHRLRVLGQQRPLLRPRRCDQRAGARPALAELLVTEYHGGPRPQELARARLWSLMSKYGWTLWGSIRIGTTGDPEIREWAQALWSRAVDEFESPEFEPLLERAARPEGD